MALVAVAAATCVVGGVDAAGGVLEVAGVGGARKRMNIVKLTMSDEKSDAGAFAIGLVDQIGLAFRSAVQLAARIAFPLVGEIVVGDALLDIVGFAREDHQGLVLGLPAKSGDGAVVAVAVEASGDAQRPLLLRVGRQSGLETRIRNGFHQSESEGRRGYAENNVVRGDRGRKVRLLDVASPRIRTPRDHEEIVHPAVRRSVRITYEARLADRTVQRDEGRHRVLGALRDCIRNLRIGRGARAACLRLYVTHAAAELVVARAQAIGNCLNLVKHVRSGGEKIQLVLAETGKRAACARSAASRTRVKRFSPRATASPVSPSPPTDAMVVGCRDILGELLKQIESTSILRKSRSRQSSRSQHRGSYARNGPPPYILCHFYLPSSGILGILGASYFVEAE